MSSFSTFKRHNIKMKKEQETQTQENLTCDLVSLVSCNSSSDDITHDENNLILYQVNLLKQRFSTVGLHEVWVHVSHVFLGVFQLLYALKYTHLHHPYPCGWANKNVSAAYNSYMKLHRPCCSFTLVLFSEILRYGLCVNRHMGTS